MKILEVNGNGIGNRLLDLPRLTMEVAAQIGNLLNEHRGNFALGRSYRIVGEDYEVEIGVPLLNVEKHEEMNEQIAQDRRNEAVEFLIDDAMDVYCASGGWRFDQEGDDNTEHVRAALRFAYDKWGV